MTITRLSATDYHVVTDCRLADGSLRQDDCMRLMWSVRFGAWVLRSHEQRGSIRIGGLMTVPLGDYADPRVEQVRNLAIGATLEVTK